MFENPALTGVPLLPILNSVSDGVALVLPHSWRIVHANETFSDWLGRSANALHGRSIEELLSPPSRPRLTEHLQQALNGDGASAAIPVTLRLGEFLERETAVRCCRVVIDAQRLVAVVFQASTLSSVNGSSGPRRDPLTDLPDRAYLLSRLSTLLEGDRAADRQFAVLFVDLDNFKQVNDRYGHLLGDRVLREVAGRLSDCVREGDHVTRFGGDEFVVLLEGVAGPHDIEPVVARVHDAVAEAIVLAEGVFHLSLSIGVAQAAAHHQSADDVLRDADRAMYAAKRAAICPLPGSL